MKTKSLGRYTFLLLFVMIRGDVTHLFGANMRSFIESVRRKAPVVYLGSVKEVRELQQTKFDIKAVMRTPGSNPRQATLEYSSYDEKTPMLEGGPQYQLRPGISVIIFADSFDARIPPDISCRGAARSCCSELMPYVMLLARCPPTNSR